MIFFYEFYKFVNVGCGAQSQSRNAILKMYNGISSPNIFDHPTHRVHPPPKKKILFYMLIILVSKNYH